MTLLGIDQSVERTVVAAAGIQFLISVAQAVLPFVTTGVARVALVAVLFVGAALALVNTVWITREDVVIPVQRLEAAADRIAAGEVDVPVATNDDPTEIGSLTRSFAEMGSHIELVAAQADALADQEFEADVLDQRVPGAFGESLSRMATNLQEYTDELETMTADLERRSARLESLVAAFADAADRAADGDLTATLDADDIAEEDDQYREICENYNRLVGTLGATIGDVRAFAEEVSTASDDVAASMDELDRTSDEVAGSIQAISDGANHQTEQFQSVAERMNDLSATVQQIAASADEVADTAGTAAERGRSGRAAATEAIDALDNLEGRIDRTADAVEGLADRITEIEEIVSFIDGIAEETNMLALNASIEAARAGGGDGTGDGFAVVADEVKGLAEETRDAAEEVGDLVDELQRESAETATTVREMHDQVGDSVATIGDALDDFEDIVAVVDELDQSVREISDATDEQAETTQDVVARVDEVASISEETRDEAESVAAAAEQQTASVSTASADIQSVAEHADDLRSALDRFRLPDETGPEFDAEAPIGATASRAAMDD